jgi:cytochrome c-type biogenesis protein CcmH
VTVPPTAAAPSTAAPSRTAALPSTAALGPAAIALALVLAALLWPAVAPAAPRERTSLTAVWNDYMCVSCHEPLPVAQSAQANSERGYIQLLVTEGDTARQIERKMVAAYSDAVLAKPPAQGFDLTLYILPPVALVLGVALLSFALPKWRARAQDAASTPYAAGAGLSIDDAARLERDLARFD